MLDKVLKPTSTDKRKKRKRGLRAEQQTTDGAEELFHSVECEICQTEVGARDQDEVFHFFHVVATNA